MTVTTICRDHAMARQSRARAWTGTLAVLLLLLVLIPTASAVPLISIDMDTSTAGIQSSLSIEQGNSFSIDVVVTGDGMSLFDTAIFQVDFNNAGPVLGLSGGPTAGSLASMAPFVLDVFSVSGAPAVPGGPLTVFPAAPAPGYTSTSGSIGLVSLGLPFTPLLPGTVAGIFRLNMDALGLGTSMLSVAGPGLAFAGAPVLVNTANGTVTVTDPGGPTIPEPSMLMLFSLGLLGLGLSRRRTGAR